MLVHRSSDLLDGVVLVCMRLCFVTVSSAPFLQLFVGVVRTSSAHSSMSTAQRAAGVHAGQAQGSLCVCVLFATGPQTPQLADCVAGRLEATWRLP